MQQSALILSGGWDGHQPHVAAEIFGGALERRGLRVEYETTLDPLADLDRLATVDLIVPNVTMGQITREQEQGLLAAVAAGCGCAGWHGGMGDAFRASCDYQFLTGGQFVAHPDGITTYTVNIADPDHGEICRGLGDFSVTSEQYYMYVDPHNTVLATTTFESARAPWVNGCVMPVAWTRTFGTGRVFYSSLGHTPDVWDIPQARELQVRGLLWACRTPGERHHQQDARALAAPGSFC